MRTLKIYLDTFVISHLDAQDVPEKMMETHKLWNEIKLGVYKLLNYKEIRIVAPSMLLGGDDND